MIICCDIDGVLADVRPYVEEYLPRDWKTYFSHTEEFKCIRDIASLMIHQWMMGNHVTYVTGRPESNRLKTENWLGKNVRPILYTDELLMRKDEDPRPTCDIKMEWFRELKPNLIIDDDPEVVKAATKEGFIVLQVHGFRCTEKDSIPENFLEEVE